MAYNEITSTQYAEYRDDAPETWRSPQPAFNIDKFNKELLRRGGRLYDRPRFRCVWGGERNEYLIEDAEGDLLGYDYRLDGKDFYVPASQTDFEFPDAAIITPRFDRIKVFTPRWIIEEYRLYGIGAFQYHKAWAVELVKVLGKKSGRVDLLSMYRKPSEKDIQMCERLARARDTSTEDQIRNGIAAEKALEARRKAHLADEMKAEIAEDIDRAITDGIGDKTTFGFEPNLTTFDIREFSKKKIQEHDSK